MPHGFAFAPIALLAAALCTVAKPMTPPAAARQQPPAALVGVYDGGQTEVAAGLELRGDGRFRFAMSYGALDETGEGAWSVEGGRVLLAGDPVMPPRFTLLEHADGPAGRLAIDLDLPRGLSRSYFDAEIRVADGRTVRRQLGENGLVIELADKDRPVDVALALPIWDLRSDPARLAARGDGRIRFRFEPNDLGKVRFARTPLRIDGAELILEHRGLTIRFRRVAASVPDGDGSMPGHPAVR